jgi:hypothetical protein
VAIAFAESDGVIASDLTVVECERVLIRAWSSGLLTEADRIDQGAALARASAHWTRLRLDQRVRENGVRLGFEVVP